MAQNLITKHVIETIVKPTLDKGEREKLKTDLNRIFTDASNIDFNTKETHESLNNLAKAFRAIFDQAGDKSIDFEKLIKMPAPDMFAKLGEIAAKQFWDAWNSVGKVQLQIDYSKELDKLKKDKAALISEQNAIKNSMIGRLDKINRFDINSANRIKVDGDIVAEANRVLDELYEYGNKIIDADKNSPNYSNLVLDAQEKYNYYLRMQKTLMGVKGLPKDLKASYDLFKGDERDNYEINGGENIPFVESFQSDAISEAFDELSEKSLNFEDRLDEIKTELGEIDTKIENISAKIREVKSADNGIFDEAKDGLKTLDEIQKAYENILSKKVVNGEQLADQNKIKSIQSAIDFDPSKSNKGIKSLYGEYQEALASGDWTKEYQALLKYVKLYESYLTSENAAHRKKTENIDYKDLYARIKPMAENAKNMLQNIINAANKVSLVGMGGPEQKSQAEVVNEALSQQKSSLTDIEKLINYIDEHYLSAGKHLSDFLNDLQNESNELNGELKEILTTLNLIDDSGNLKLDIKRNGEDGSGTTHNGALISDDFVIIERTDYEQVKTSRMPDATKDATENGINVAKILGYLPSKYTSGFFDVQDRAKGNNLFKNGVLSQDVVNAPDKALEQLIQAFIKARDYGFDIENGGSNIVYDPEKREFSFYDLEELSEDDAEYWKSMSESEKKLYALENLFSLFSGINRDHTNFKNDANVYGFAERIKNLIANKNIITPDELDRDGRNYEDIFNDVFSGDIDAESENLMALLQKEAEARQRITEAAEKEKLAKEALVETNRKVEKTQSALIDISSKMSGASNEHMSLIGMDGRVSTIGGDEYAVDTNALVRQLIDNLKNSILMSLHNHPDGMLAFTPSDIRSYGGLFKGQGIDIHGIISDGIIKTIDFSNVSQEVILQVARSFSDNLSKAAQLSDGLFNYQNEEIIISDEMKGLMGSSPEAYEAIRGDLIKLVDNALTGALKDNGVESKLRTFTNEQLPQLAEYLLQIQQRAQGTISPIEKLKGLMPIINSIKGLKDVDNIGALEKALVKRKEIFDLLQQEGLLTDEMRANYNAVNAEIQEKINLLKQANSNQNSMQGNGVVKEGANNLTPQYDSNFDDDSEIIAKENGTLEDKLELLRDIADQYAANITQKQRDRYEELNQKDMDTGLSDKEDERYYELGEQIDAADSALEEFGQTYDRIILKLENGKKVEILPDDKGLRSLYKFSDEYGETYGGVEIEDVIFERVKQEANAHQENTTAIKNETKAQEELNNVNIKAADDNNSKKLKSYEELVAVVKEYFNLASQLKEEFNYSGMRQDACIISDRYEDIDTNEGKREQMMKDYNALWSEREKVKKSLQTGATYISSDGNEYLGNERKIEQLTEEINALSAAYIDLGGSVDDFSSKAKKMSAATSWNLFKKSEEQDLANDKVAEEFNNPIKEKMNAIEASLVKQQLNPDSLAVWSALEINSGKFEDRLNAIARALGIEIPQAAQQAQQAVGGLNDELQTAGNNADNIDDKIGDGSIFGTGTGDASSSDVDAAKAEAEKQRLENERLAAEKLALQQEYEDRLKAKDAEIAEANRKREEAELAERVAQDEASAERHIRDTEAADAEEKFRVKDGIIQELREQLTQVQSGEGGAKASIDVEELKSILNAITYNVKVVQDAEGADNKVAIDEASLEATLNKVFANILNTQTRQNDGEQKQSPWALESTLQTVKGTLDNIQTNTAKIGTVEASNVDTIAGTTLDGRLTEIKTVLESIDNKIAKGGVIITRGAVKQASTDAQETPAKVQAVRSNMMKSITNDYETLGKLSAQFANDGNLETKAKLENLKEEIKRKRGSLKVTMEENAKLREKYSIAFDGQKRLLEAAKAQKVIDDQRKLIEKDSETAWKKRVKDAQRASGINAATSTANAGDQSVLRAIGTDDISADFEKKARELSNQIKALRSLRDEIYIKDEQTTEKDRDDLSNQISKVKELKTEVDSYLKIHEKYSGENVTDFGDASAFGTAGTDEYWNNITKTIQTQSQGKVVINGLNAATGELTGTTKIAANTFATWSATVDPITKKLVMLRTGIKKTQTLVEAITRKTKEIFTYFSGSSIIFKFFNELKRGVQYVKEIDLALTELKKVTDETEETYDKFLKTASKTGAEIGSTISDVTRATATFAKLGYNIDMASDMAKAALVYQNVGDGIESADAAAESIISTIKGFGLQASEAMTIVDRFNEVGNRFSITSKGIGDALQRSASALKEGGNSLDESIGLITAANSVVQDPETVGKNKLADIKSGYIS